MCGIAGYWGSGDEKILRGMIDKISYRGPNDRGYFNDSVKVHSNAVNIGLAQCRLSIIDLSSAGHQPMFNEDKTVVLIFNGEIYNHIDLKKELHQEHVFKSNTDTEVIIHLFEEYGAESFEMLHGMFAIALYDLKNSLLYLVRDRMGKKPLYYGVNNSNFIFGSELKALVSHPSFNKDIDLNSLNSYLFYENVPTPNTIFKNTYKVEPGSYVMWNGNKITKQIFWKPTFLPKSNDFNSSLKDIDEALESAVRDRLVADVPLGVFLSGGLDSSIMTYYASKILGNKVKTFSIGFGEKTFDESRYAKNVAKYFNTEHFEKIVTAKDSLDLIPKIGEMIDEPMADSSIIPTYILSKFTKEHVTVALSGDGGDELFCGYDPFLAHKLSFIYEAVPESLRNKIVEPLINALPTSFSNMSLDFKLKKFISGFNGERKYRNHRWLSAFDSEERKNLFNKDVYNLITVGSDLENIDQYLREVDSTDSYDELTLLYERMYLMDQVLVKVDRASMLNSLEVRSPFLDTRVVELANHLPIEHKLRGLNRKYILKKLMENKLPDDIIYRKKKGFGIPIAEWIGGELKGFVKDLFDKRELDRMGLFNVEYIHEILNDHFNGLKDNRKKIWTLMCFVMWWRNYMNK